MTDILREICQGLREIFPEMGDIAITPETQLREIPDWDSMSSVNFQGFLEQKFGISIPQELLGEEISISDVISFIIKPESVSQSL